MRREPGLSRIDGEGASSRPGEIVLKLHGTQSVMYVMSFYALLNVIIIKVLLDYSHTFRS